MKAPSQEEAQRIAALASEADALPLFSEARSAKLREIGNLWKELGFPQFADMFYAAADAKPNDPMS